MIIPEDHLDYDRDGFARDWKDWTRHRPECRARVDASIRKREHHAVGFVTFRRVMVPVQQMMQSRERSRGMQGEEEAKQHPSHAATKPATG
ncbi:MAG: hypothetical protein ACKO3H_10800 [Verrucomicrobiota bacterium]